jgi:hypothetical protein
LPKDAPPAESFGVLPKAIVRARGKASGAFAGAAKAATPNGGRASDFAAKGDTPNESVFWGYSGPGAAGAAPLPNASVASGDPEKGDAPKESVRGGNPSGDEVAAAGAAALLKASGGSGETGTGELPKAAVFSSGNASPPGERAGGAKCAGEFA